MTRKASFGFAVALLIFIGTVTFCIADSTTCIGLAVLVPQFTAGGTAKTNSNQGEPNSNGATR